jgi:hypothetical protein
MEASEEKGRRAGEEWLRCGMNRGGEAPFMGPGRGSKAVVMAMALMAIEVDSKDLFHALKQGLKEGEEKWVSSWWRGCV